MTSPYRGLIADFGGVVSTSFSGALRGFCVREGLPPDTLEQVFSVDGGARGLLTDLERGLITQQQFVDHLVTALGVGPDRLLQRILADLALEPVVVEAVERLRRNGIRTAVLSNSWGDGPYDPYQPFDLPSRFDVVVLSHEVGLRKPDPAIFTLTADRLGLAPEQCVFTDDVGAYLTPARDLGMATVHATDPGATAASLHRLFGVDSSVSPQAASSGAVGQAEPGAGSGYGMPGTADSAGDPDE
ncbi:HAD family hydrolase [Nocardia wallacei]|uniref:HAD family hydrolase n=1 Tax=Nocardia wallacei TaxID=480035 RepID=UPI0024570301|nr:HAD family phosphatase [Nocardia wallacei]